MAITESDKNILRYFNRLSLFFAHNATHKNLQLDLDNPRKYFNLLGQSFINKYLGERITPDFSTIECDMFSIACFMLRKECILKDNIIELYRIFRKQETTEEDLLEFKEFLGKERA